MFCERLLGLLGGCLSSLLYLHICVMSCIGSLSLSGYLTALIAALVSRCILGSAPSYLRSLCRPVSDVAARRVLRSATRGELLVPRARLATAQRRAFSIVGPSIWNDLPHELRLLLPVNLTGFLKSLKTFYFGRGWTGSASE